MFVVAEVCGFRIGPRSTVCAAVATVTRSLIGIAPSAIPSAESVAVTCMPRFWSEATNVLKSPVPLMSTPTSPLPIIISGNCLASWVLSLVCWNAW